MVFASNIQGNQVEQSSATSKASAANNQGEQNSDINMPTNDTHGDWIVMERNKRNQGQSRQGSRITKPSNYGYINEKQKKQGQTRTSGAGKGKEKDGISIKKRRHDGGAFYDSLKGASTSGPKGRHNMGPNIGVAKWVQTI